MYFVLPENYTSNSNRHTFWWFLSFILCKLLQTNRCFTLQQACDVSDSFISPNKWQNTKTPSVFLWKIILQQEHSQDQKRWKFINPLISSVRYDHHTVLCSKHQMRGIADGLSQPLLSGPFLIPICCTSHEAFNSSTKELSITWTGLPYTCIYGKVETWVTSKRHSILCMISCHFPHFWIHMLNATVLPAKPS